MASETPCSLQLGWDPALTEVQCLVQKMNDMVTVGSDFLHASWDLPGPSLLMYFMAKITSMGSKEEKRRTWSL